MSEAMTETAEIEAPPASSLPQIHDHSSATEAFGTIYESPTLSRLPRDVRPSPSTVCETCPAAVWYALPGELRAFCRVMHVQVYSNEEKNDLQACDGREMAIEQLLAKQQAA